MSTVDRRSLCLAAAGALPVLLPGGAARALILPTSLGKSTGFVS